MRIAASEFCCSDALINRKKREGFFSMPETKIKGAVKEPNVHSQPHYNFISSKPMKEKNA